MAHCAGQAYVFLVQSSLFLKEVFLLLCVLFWFFVVVGFCSCFFVLVRWARDKMVCALLTGVRSRNQGDLGERCGFGGLGGRRTHARAGERGRA